MLSREPICSGSGCSTDCRSINRPTLQLCSSIERDICGIEQLAIVGFKVSPIWVIKVTTVGVAIVRDVDVFVATLQS